MKLTEQEIAKVIRESYEEYGRIADREGRNLTNNWNDLADFQARAILKADAEKESAG